MYEQAANFIKDLGFPIFVAGYLLIHFRKSLCDNTKAVSKNTEMLKELAVLVKNFNSKSAKKH